MDVQKFLSGFAEEQKQAYSSDQPMRTFASYLEALAANPARLTRNAAQYFSDVIDYYGAYSTAGIGGPVQRHAVFDAPFAAGQGAVYGQELVAGEIINFIRTFARAGRIDRLILLTGPNGSAKSSLLEAIMRGAENYSRTTEGMLFRFNWVFPRRDEESKPMGFSRREARPESYALLPMDEIAARIPCELKDPPWALLPQPARGEFFHETVSRMNTDEQRDFQKTPWLLEGGLCHKCRKIYDSLRDFHEGDLTAVWRYVQVERYTLSLRHRRGLTVVSPQISPDAQSAPLNYEHYLAALPGALQQMRFFEAQGDLVDADQGAIEFSDLLKRPIEANKYLLTTCETGRVSLAHLNLDLNLLLFASSNERHFDALKSSPDFTSFKGRMLVVKTPYLLERHKEQQIYDGYLREVRREKHVAPLTAALASLFALLTRVEKPRSEHFPPALRPLISRLTPLDKVRLYDSGETPEDFEPEEKRMLLSGLPQLRDEFTGQQHYEGHSGASARELREVLTACFDKPGHPCVSPRALLAELRELAADRSLYLFLQRDVDAGYHDIPAFLELCELEYLERSEAAFAEAAALVEEGEYLRQIEKYLQHVKGWVQKELVAGPNGERQSPDEAFLKKIEARLQIDRRAGDFRADLLSRVGAFRLEHPDQEVDARTALPDLLAGLKAADEGARQKALRIAYDDLLLLGSDEEKFLSPERKGAAKKTRARLIEHHGYCDHCLKEAASALVRRGEHS